MMKKALGKGLSALIPDQYQKQVEEQRGNLQEPAKEQGFSLIPISKIQPNRDQPRKEFLPEALEDLAASIKEKGILQPVIVKKVSDGNYELICGERRMRASLLCGLTAIPAIIKDIADQDLLEWALIENIQRQDLNAIEEAEAYQKLSEERMLTQDELAKRVGKNRATITNSLRILRLPEEVKEKLIYGSLTAGHARALLALPTPEHQRQLAKRIEEEKLSVRQVESIVNRSLAHKRKSKRARNLSPEIIDLEERLARHLGTQVKVMARKNQKQGKLEIYYFSLDDLDRVLESMGLPKN